MYNNDNIHVKRDDPLEITKAEVLFVLSRPEINEGASKTWRVLSFRICVLQSKSSMKLALIISAESVLLADVFSF